MTVSCTVFKFLSWVKSQIQSKIRSRGRELKVIIYFIDSWSGGGRFTSTCKCQMKVRTPHTRKILMCAFILNSTWNKLTFSLLEPRYLGSVGKQVLCLRWGKEGDCWASTRTVWLVFSELTRCAGESSSLPRSSPITGLACLWLGSMAHARPCTLYRGAQVGIGLP